jgi:hypothetical protein
MVPPCGDNGWRLAAGVVANGFSFQPAVKSEIEVLTSAHDR